MAMDTPGGNSAVKTVLQEAPPAGWMVEGGEGIGAGGGGGGAGGGGAGGEAGGEGAGQTHEELIAQVEIMKKQLEILQKRMITPPRSKIRVSSIHKKAGSRLRTSSEKKGKGVQYTISPKQLRMDEGGETPEKKTPKSTKESTKKPKEKAVRSRKGKEAVNSESSGSEETFSSPRSWRDPRRELGYPTRGS